MEKQNLSLIIPAFNEVNRLSRTLPEIKEYFEKFPGNFEVLVIDDGSTDDTRKYVEDFKDESPNFPVSLNPKRTNQGKGYSVKEGFFLSQYEWILFSDADLSTPLKEIEHFQKYIPTHDVIIASRDLPDSKVEAQPFYRKAMGRIFSLMSNLITGLNIRDTQCGFKMFSREAGDVIFPRQTVNGFGFDVELLFIAKKYRFRIKEVPVEWVNDLDSKINNLTDSLDMMRDLFYVRFNDWFRKKY